MSTSDWISAPVRCCMCYELWEDCLCNAITFNSVNTSTSNDNTELAAKLERLANELRADVVVWGEAVITCEEAARRLRAKN